MRAACVPLRRPRSRRPRAPGRGGSPARGWGPAACPRSPRPQQVPVGIAVLHDHHDQKPASALPVAKPRGVAVEESPRVLHGGLRAVHQILEASRHEAVRQGLQVGAQRLRGHAPAQLPAGLAQGRPVQQIGEESVVAGPARQHSLGGARALLVTQPCARPAGGV